MFKVLPLSLHLSAKINKYGLEKKFNKQCKLLSINPKHPSLHLELLEPKKHAVYSIRVDKKFRALLFFNPDTNFVEFIAITVHYH